MSLTVFIFIFKHPIVKKRSCLANAVSHALKNMTIIIYMFVYSFERTWEIIVTFNNSRQLWTNRSWCFTSGQHEYALSDDNDNLFVHCLDLFCVINTRIIEIMFYL